MLNHTDPNTADANGERSSIKIPHPIFSDKRVRQAFAYAIDRQAIAALYGIMGRPAAANLIFFSEDTTSGAVYDFNLEKARALLDESGWTDTNGDGVRDKNGAKMKVVFQAYTNQILWEAQLIVQQALQSIGVEVELKIVDASILFGAGVNPDSIYRFSADMSIFSLRSTSTDPGGYMVNWTCPSVPQKSNNWTGLNLERWCNPEYDALYQQARAELDPAKRLQIYLQMNQMLIEDVVMIPVVQSATIYGIGPGIVGVDLTPWDATTWNIMDWERQP